MKIAYLLLGLISAVLLLNSPANVNELNYTNTSKHYSIKLIYKNENKQSQYMVITNGNEKLKIKSIITEDCNYDKLDLGSESIKDLELCSDVKCQNVKINNLTCDIEIERRTYVK